MYNENWFIIWKTAIVGLNNYDIQKLYLLFTVTLYVKFTFYSCGNAKRSLAKLCSLNAGKPFPIYSQDGCIDIKFVSGENGEDDDISSFTAIYSSRPYSDARDLWWVK